MSFTETPASTPFSRQYWYHRHLPECRYLMWVQRAELRSSFLYRKLFFPLSHLPGFPNLLKRVYFLQCMFMAPWWSSKTLFLPWLFLLLVLFSLFGLIPFGLCKYICKICYWTSCCAHASLYWRLHCEPRGFNAATLIWEYFCCNSW